MAKKKRAGINSKTLGIFLISGLVIEYVLPAIKLGSLSWIATLIYLAVAIYLVFVH